MEEPWVHLRIPENSLTECNPQDSDRMQSKGFTQNGLSLTMLQGELTQCTQCSLQ